MSDFQQGWLSCTDFAGLLGIDSRRARNALAKAHAGKPYRGVRLRVDVVRGRGGKAGRQYVVAVDSIPPAWLMRRLGLTDGQEATAAEPSLPFPFAESAALPVPSPQSRPAVTAVEPRSLPPVSTPVKRAGSAPAQARREWLRRIIDPALVHPPRSHLRGDAVRLIAATEHVAPDGSVVRLSERTVLRCLARYEGRGVEGLGRRVRSDHGQRRTIISKQWDKATAGLIPDEKRQAIRKELEHHLARLYRSGTQSSALVAHLASNRLAELTEAAGVVFSPTEAREICKLPRAPVERPDLKRFRQLAIKEHDAKRFSDHHRPRIRRDRSNLRPLDFIAGDVHKVDVLYTRADGSTATPYMIAWLDLATNRVFATFLFLNKGEGVRQGHVIESFINMVGAWGLPGRLYLDNGSEYQWTDFAEDALRLGRFTGREVIVDSSVTRSRPYAPEGKIIETVFSVLAKLFVMVPGFIGGNRIAKKTQNVGRAPDPYPGGTAELEQTLRKIIDLYHALPLTSGHLQGRSPNEAWNQFICEGWGKIEVDLVALEACFAKEESRRVRAGGVVCVEGIEYRADELQPHVDEYVAVRRSKVGDLKRLTVFDGAGKFLCLVTPQASYSFGDPAGAREASRRNSELTKDLRALDGAAPPLDMVAEVGRAVVRQPDAMEPTIAGRVWLSEKEEATAQALKLAPKAKPSRLPQAHADAERFRNLPQPRQRTARG